MTVDASAAHARKCRFRTCPKKSCLPTCILEDRQSSIGWLRGRRQGRSLENPPPPSNGRVEWRAETLCSISGLHFPLPEPTAMPPAPPHQVNFPSFFTFNFGFDFLFFFKPLANLPKPPKIVQKAPKTLPKTLPKLHQNRIFSCNARNPKQIQPSYTKPSFLTFPSLRKSS